MYAESIWRMVQESARKLTRQGNVPFTRTDLIACVQQQEPNCGPDSINPVIQGITDNLVGGAPGATGKKILYSVGRGIFVLYSKKDDKVLMQRTHLDRATTSQSQRLSPDPVANIPSTESELRDNILGILDRKLIEEKDIELVPEGRLPYTLPDGHTLYHASDILARRTDGQKYVSIEVKYKSAVTDQFKCRSYDAQHMKQEYGNRMLCIMLFVKTKAGISIGQAQKICHPFDRFIGVPIAEINESTIWDSLADEIANFL